MHIILFPVAGAGVVKVRIEAFAAGPDAPWGLQTVIADAQIIPRASQTVDLLAFILGVPGDEVDEIFRQAIALRA